MASQFGLILSNKMRLVNSWHKGLLTFTIAQPFGYVTFVRTRKGISKVQTTRGGLIASWTWPEQRGSASRTSARCGVQNPTERKDSHGCVYSVPGHAPMESQNMGLQIFVCRPTRCYIFAGYTVKNRPCNLDIDTAQKICSVFISLFHVVLKYITKMCCLKSRLKNVYME